MNHKGYLRSWEEADQIESLFQPWVLRSGLPKMYRLLVKQSASLGWPVHFGMPDKKLMNETRIRVRRSFERDLTRMERWQIVERTIGKKEQLPIYRLCSLEETRIPLPPEKMPQENLFRIPRKIPRKKRVFFLRTIRSLEEILKLKKDRKLIDIFWSYYRRSSSLTPEEAALLANVYHRFGASRLQSIFLRNARTSDYRWRELLEMLVTLSSEDENPLR